MSIIVPVIDLYQDNPLTGITLVNCTIDDDVNVITNLPLNAIKTVPANTNRFITRNGSGAVVDTVTLPSGAVVGTTDTQTLTNKTISGSNNTLSNIALTSLANGTANTFVTRNGSGVAVNTVTLPTGAVVGTTDTQTLTNKTLGTGTIIGSNATYNGITFQTVNGNLRNPNLETIAQFFGSAGTVNYLRFIGSVASGGNTQIAAAGTDTNVGITIAPQGTGKIQLPDITQVSIQGGTSGQVLGTNGSGNLSWVTVPAPSKIIKTSTQTLINSTTYTTDTQLVLNMLANTYYTLQYHCFFQSSAEYAFYPNIRSRWQYTNYSPGSGGSIYSSIGGQFSGEQSRLQVLGQVVSATNVFMGSTAGTTQICYIVYTIGILAPNSNSVLSFEWAPEQLAPTPGTFSLMNNSFILII